MDDGINEGQTASLKLILFGHAASVVSRFNAPKSAAFRSERPALVYCPAA